MPILVIRGGRGEEERKLGVLIQHQAKEIESQLRIYNEVTCAARTIDDPLCAAKDIDEVIRSICSINSQAISRFIAIWSKRKSPFQMRLSIWIGEFPYPHSDRHKINETVRETAERFNRAHNPIVLVGIEAYRFKSAKDIVRLGKKMGVPCCTSVLARALSP